MRAAVYTRWGSADVLRIVDLPKPVPGDDEVLVRVRAASINAPDWRIMRGKPYIIRLFFGLRKPKIRSGTDFAGEVEAVGKDVMGVKPGNMVFGAGRGAFAEYVCTRSSRITPKPDTVTCEQAAAIPVAGLTALQGLRNIGKLRAGQSVLINGASGGVGTFAVQIAKAFDASVTAVCSTPHVELMRSIGADHIIDYTKEDFTKGRERYDLIFDVAGNHSLSQLRRVLNDPGIGVLVGAPKSVSLFHILWVLAGSVVSRFGSRKFIGILAKARQADLKTLGELVEDKIVTPVIDRQYALSEIVEAMTYVDRGHAQGKVVITLP